MSRTRVPTRGGLRWFLLPAVATLALLAALAWFVGTVEEGAAVPGWALLASIVAFVVLTFVAARKWGATLPKFPVSPPIIPVEKE